MNDLSHPNDGLSPAARAALAALRAEDDLPPEVRDRLWARIERGAHAPSDMSDGPATGSSRRWGGAALGLAIAAGLILAAVELGRGATQLAAAPRADAAAYDDADAARRLSARAGAAVGPSSGTVVEAAPEQAEPEQAEPIAQPPRPAIREAAVRAPAAVPGDRSDVPGDSSTLAAEAALLQRAQTALAAGDPGAALQRLGEHAAQFAGGVLARERDALRVTALCAAGRTQEGRAEAAAFLRAHAGSLLAERVRGACAAP